MEASPPEAGALDCGCAGEEEKNLEGVGGLVGSVGVEAVISFVFVSRRCSEWRLAGCYLL